MEGLVNLSPRRLQKLLEDCKSVKVKRLFFFLADRHAHAWLKRTERGRIDLGKGKRMLVRGGKLDPKYQITVPGDLDAVQPKSVSWGVAGVREVADRIRHDGGTEGNGRAPSG
jgi:hypothetical protein